MKGAQTFANYVRQDISEYAGNPLIEALPPILSEAAAVELISNFPQPVDPKELTLEGATRIHCIDRLRTVVQPFLLHLELEALFSLLIRRGYVGRNPMSPATVRHLHSLSGAQRYHDAFKSTAETFTVVGLSGIGKSTALHAILSLYPQTIRHERYEGKQFVHTQITWLKLDCPRDGSLAGFCQQFFYAVGDALGDKDYHKRYRHRNINDALQQMEQVASTFFIGALLIDELQNLHLAKTGGKESMLNFFLHLVNNIGIPVVFSGTNSTISLFSEAMRTARRVCGAGTLEFKRFEKDDEEWRLLVENLWSYQWCKQTAELTDEIFDMLYEHTQGVTDFLVKLLVLSQRYAVQSGSECLTAEILVKVSNSKMQILKPALSALRSRDPKRMRQFDDLLPIEDQLSEMMVFDGLAREDRLALLRSVVSREKPADPSPSILAKDHPSPIATAVESSEAKALSEHDAPLDALRAAGWLNEDLFEFSPMYHKA
ncbi:ATP-binding protein [Pseudomonas koreensis]|jgi:ABC-type dipeptide/oligopeptide/nickel transport system ATPase component|uniref:Tn7 transposition protein C n=3 Tax=Pseudomonas TaxID=286 RepID=A0A0B1Z0E3_9PSED|nr:MULTISPECIES: ATP-binding protein [Pseudomonas]MEE5099943.1 ATP-binding protein [Pseudomonas alliivorans]PYB92334.1 ATP-binding protein [Pseudomonas koreensis]KHK62753.1 Tn7 transposition protein C [Pseudomonas frederiksbergensis]MBJ7372307.1 ATP-binding protein [Pseudomonas sp.]MCI9873925.1 ATP-binding protein [Pseudomonas atacamensis]